MTARRVLGLASVVALGLALATSPASAQTNVVGQWGSLPALPYFPVHAALLPTGKVLIYPGDEGISGDQALILDPTTGSTTPAAHAGYDLFCSAHSFLADGRLLVSGGHIQNFVGVSHASIYDPFADVWTRLPDMNAGRWYPNNTTLPNGDVLVVSGDIDTATGVNPLPQVYQAATGTWRNLTNAQLQLDLYPDMHLAPNGKVFNSGPSTTTRYLDTSGAGAWSVVATRVGAYRDYGSSVMYAPGKIIVMGGGDPPQRTAEIINLNAASPAWQATGSMAFARRQMNATLLPDGTVLATGGTSGAGFNNASGAVFAAELWNPSTGLWSTMASAGVVRIYHSTALLLPDGRVLSMGGNEHPEVEVYSPPYLFKGARPTLTSAPGAVGYGQTFFVQTPDAASITRVTSIPLPSVTHAFNQNQRINDLTFVPTAGGLTVTAPSNPNLAPLGYYMLFLLNGQGVPSVAAIVQLTSTASTAPSLTSLSPASAAVGGAPFTLTVNGGNFVAGSTVQWNGAPRATTFVSSGQVTAAIPASDLAAAGTASVTVEDPGGALSNALTFTIAAGGDGSTPCGTGGYFAEYFGNTTLAGPPTFTQCEPSINHDWGTTGPGNGLGTTGYSVRWTGTVSLAAGTWNFTATTSDGMRLWVDGNLLIDAWIDQPTTTYQAAIALGAGNHTVKAEYYENTGAAVAQIGWQAIPTPTPALTSLSPASALPGSGAFTLTVNGSNFVDGASVFWKGVRRTTTFVSPSQLTAAIDAPDVAAAGTAAVTVQNPGGIASNALTFTIGAGGGGGATSCPTGQFLAQYFANQTLTGTAVFTDCEPAINYNWGTTGPGVGGLGGTNFSVRWDGFFNFSSGTYNFTATADDGIRVFVDGELIINGWVLQAPTTYQGAISLAGGAHEVKVEYFQNGGGAVAQVSWLPVATGTPTLTSLAPSSALAGGAAFTLAVNGTNFVAGGATVLWNGAPRPTTFVSPTQLTAAIAAADIATAGTASVSVVNPGSVPSANALTFSIIAPGICPTGQFFTQYFANQTLAGTPVFTRCEAAINDNWGTTGPGVGGLGGTNFSVRWDGFIAFNAGTYTFTATADDGIRVWVDGIAIIDKWILQAPTTYQASIALAAGSHEVKVEYFQNGGGAVAQVSWQAVATPTPTLTSLAPSTATAGGPAFTLTANGTNFITGAMVQWNGSPRPTTLVSATQLTAAITAADIAAAGSVPVTVAYPGGVTSNALAFTLSSPTPALTSLAPSSAAAGGAAFTLTVNGTSFITGATVQWSGSPRTTTFVSPTQVTAAIAAADIATAGSASVSVVNPGSVASNTLTFTINTAAPSLTSLAPSSATAGGAAFTLTVNGANFLNGATIQWNGAPRSTTFVSGTQLTAAIAAADIAAAGSASVTVVNPGNFVSSALGFTINNPPPSLTSLAPSSATAGDAAFTLTVNGTGFLNGATVQWNGTARTTTFVSATQLTAAISAADVAAVGSASVTAINPGSVASNALGFAVNAPVPSLTSLAPSSATAGGAAFTLTVNGASFLNGATVQWNGSPRTTTFVSATQLTAAIAAADIATAGSAAVTVANPGNVVSNALTFAINAPPLSLTSLAPSSATAGGAAFTLTVNGVSFVTGATVQWNGSSRTTTFVSATQLTAAIAAADIATAGSAAVTVVNPDTTTSNALTFTINAAPPVLTALAPSSAIAGDAGFTLTVNGTGFASGATVQWNGAARTTTFVSATQLTAAITAADVAAVGSASVTAINPGSVPSNALPFAINAPVPSLTSLAPSSATAGGAAFTLTVNGTSFLSGATVQWNGAARATTFVGPTQLTAAIAAADIAAAGSASVTVVNPGSVASNALTFAITAPVPSLTSLAPASATAGSAAFTLTVNGTSFVNGATVQWNGAARTTTFVSGTQLTAAIAAADIAAAGSASVTVVNPGSVPSSNALAFSVIAPGTCPSGQFFTQYFANQALTGTPVFTRCEAAINYNWGTTGPGVGGLGGTNFSVRWDGFFNLAAGTYTFTATADDGIRVSVDGTLVINAWVLQAPTTYTASLALAAGSHEVKVEYFQAGGGAVAQVSWQATVTPTPTLTSLVPASALAGGAAFTLIVNGTNFLNGATVQWNGSPRTTTFVSGTQLTAAITAADIANAGSASVTAVNPGTAASNALTFTITAPGTCPGGQFFTQYFPNQTLTGTAVFTDCEQAINYNWGTTGPGVGGLGGTNFSVRWDGFFTFAAGTYTFTATADDGIRVWVDGTLVINAWILQAPTTYTASLALTAGAHEVKVEYFQAGGGAVAQVSWQAAVTPTPTLTSLVPASALAGGTAFTLTVNGTSFLNGATVQWNGSPRPTTFVSPTQLTAAITAADIAAAGSASVTAVNPGTAASNALTFTITAPGACPSGQFFTQYFANQTLAGTPVFTDCEQAINYNWGTFGPGVGGLGGTNFSVRWDGFFAFTAGTHVFTATADDGIRVWVDGTLVIDKWILQAPTTYTASLTLTAGTHEVKVEYFQAGGGAVAQVSWQ